MNCSSRIDFSKRPYEVFRLVPDTATAMDLINVNFKHASNPQTGMDSLNYQELIHRSSISHDIFADHVIEFYLVLVITEGTGEHYVNSERISLEEGTVITLCKGQVQRFSRSSEAEGIVFLWTEDFLLSTVSENEAFKSIHLFDNKIHDTKVVLPKTLRESVWMILKLLSHEVAQYSQNYSESNLRCLVQIFLNQLHRVEQEQGGAEIDHTHAKDFIAAKRLIEEHCFELKQVSDYASLLGISPRKLNQIVQQASRYRAKQLIDEVLMMKIKRLLLCEHDTVQEIAFRTGFEEPTNFFKFFKKRAGCTPEHFRKKAVR